MQIILWTTCPNSYIDAFASALAERVSIAIVYTTRLTKERLDLGWTDEAQGSYLVYWYHQEEAPLRLIDENPAAVHIVCGYKGEPISDILSKLITQGAQWCHWSERSHQGPRWYLSLYQRRRHARLINQHALGAFAVGRVAVDDLAAWGVRSDKLVMLPYSYSSEHFNGPSIDSVVDSKKDIAFCFAGSYSQRKGIDVLWNAFLGLQPTENSLTLNLVGGGGGLQGFVRTIPREPASGKRLVDWGPGGPSHVAKVLRGSHIFVLPSRYDGWGVALVEAAACGLVLIATTEVGAASQLIWQGRNGLIVPAGDVGELKSAMQASMSMLTAESSQLSLRLSDFVRPETCAEILIGTLERWRARRLV